MICRPRFRGCKTISLPPNVQSQKGRESPSTPIVLGTGCTAASIERSMITTLTDMAPIFMNTTETGDALPSRRDADFGGPWREGLIMR
jgi:hypothetical protein